MSIDPVEFGEMKSDIGHIKESVNDIKDTLKNNVDANVRLDTMEAVSKAEKRKMGIFYSVLATVFGFLASMIKGIFS